MNWIKSLFGKPDTPSDASAAAQAQIGQESYAPLPEAPDPLLSLLFHVLKDEGREPALFDEHLSLPNGLAIRAEYLEQQEFRDGAVRTATRTYVFHPDHFPDGLPEFQHASGSTQQTSIENGFRSWIRLDLATIEDAIVDGTASSLVMSMNFPASETHPAMVRKIYMGPYAHHVSQQAEQCNADDDCHTFCPCCLFTNSIEAYRELLQSPRTLGIRLFATRNVDNTIGADCRINGEDYPLGAEHLRKYVTSWPDLGFEFRKQYVVIRSVENATS